MLLQLMNDVSYNRTIQNGCHHFHHNFVPNASSIIIIPSIPYLP
jgi:hypothetical protein